jgi:hypothetical protein
MKKVFIRKQSVLGVLRNNIQTRKTYKSTFLQNNNAGGVLNSLKLKWKQLIVITLVQRLTDNINQLVTSTKL